MRRDLKPFFQISVIAIRKDEKAAVLLQVSLALSLSYTHTDTHSLSLSLAHAHTHSHSLYLLSLPAHFPHSSILSCTLANTHAHTHTRTRTHTHTHTHTQSVWRGHRVRRRMPRHRALITSQLRYNQSARGIWKTHGEVRGEREGLSVEGRWQE